MLAREVPGLRDAHVRGPFGPLSDPQIEITDKLHAWWVVTFRGRHVDTMVRAARLHRLTGEARYATWVAAQMDFYADNLERWAPQRDGARLFWQTLTEATNLVKFTEAVRLLGEWWLADDIDFVDVTMGAWRGQQLVHALAARGPGAAPLPGSTRRDSGPRD